MSQIVLATLVEMLVMQTENEHRVHFEADLQSAPMHTFADLFVVVFFPSFSSPIIGYHRRVCSVLASIEVRAKRIL